MHFFEDPSVVLLVMCVGGPMSWSSSSSSESDVSRSTVTYLSYLLKSVSFMFLGGSGRSSSLLPGCLRDDGPTGAGLLSYGCAV